MAKSRYSKLNLGPAGKFRSTVGSIVIADYSDPVSNQRTLVLERQQSAAGKSPRRKSNAKGATSPVQGGTRFDTSEAGL